MRASRVNIFNKRTHNTLQALHHLVLYILFTAGASKLHDTMARRDSEDGTRHTALSPFFGVITFLFPLGNDMSFPSFPLSGNEGNGNGGA